MMIVFVEAYKELECFNQTGNADSGKSIGPGTGPG